MLQCGEMRRVGHIVRNIERHKGMAAISSFVAGTLSLVALTFFSPVLANLAIRFGPPENFGLMVLGLVCTLYMISGSKVKGVLMIALGFLGAIIGMDIVNGTERFTLGTVNLTGGIEILSVVIGLFGVSEILLNCETITRNTMLAEKIRGLWPTLADWRASWKPMMRGSGLGFVFGLLPGGGCLLGSADPSNGTDARVSSTGWRQRIVCLPVAACGRGTDPAIAQRSGSRLGDLSL